MAPAALWVDNASPNRTHPLQATPDPSAFRSPRGSAAPVAQGTPTASEFHGSNTLMRVVDGIGVVIYTLLPDGKIASRRPTVEDVLCLGDAKPSFPGNEPVKGLPVEGFKPTQPLWKVNLVNANKRLEERVLRQIDEHVRDRGSVEIDQASVQLARRHIEDAFMRLNRAVFQPQRIMGDLE